MILLEKLDTVESSKDCEQLSKDRIKKIVMGVYIGGQSFMQQMSTNHSAIRSLLNRAEIKDTDGNNEIYVPFIPDI